MLFLDGAYVDGVKGTPRPRWVKALTGDELSQLAHAMARRIGRFLEKEGLLERDAENSYLASDTMDEDPRQGLGWPVGLDWPESGCGKGVFAEMAAEFAGYYGSHGARTTPRWP